MMRRGGWRPGKWTCEDQRVIIAVVYAAALIRAFDYATGDLPTLSRVAEAIMPLPAWAALILVGAIILADGWFSRRHLTVTIGHAILGLLYLALALGTLGAYVLPIMADLQRGTPTPQSLDGIRNAGPLLVVALIHGITALRTGIEPLPADDEQPVEVTSASAGGANG